MGTEPRDSGLGEDSAQLASESKGFSHSRREKLGPPSCEVLRTLKVYTLFCLLDLWGGREFGEEMEGWSLRKASCKLQEEGRAETRHWEIRLGWRQM